MHDDHVLLGGFQLVGSQNVGPSSKQMDYFTKLFKYRTSGVREYWIVDPLKNTIRVYNFETNETEDYTFSDSVKVGIYEDLYINFADISELLNT